MFSEQRLQFNVSDGSSEMVRGRPVSLTCGCFLNHLLYYITLYLRAGLALMHGPGASQL